MKRGQMDLAKDIRSRARGALIGLAAGDAVGTTLEFKQRDTYEPLTDMVGGGHFRLPAGTWTDDTSMALALAESLVAHSGLNTNDLMNRFVAWWRQGEYSPTGECVDIGMATRDALARFERSGDPLAGSTDPYSAGNGSLMRLAPIAIRGLSVGSDVMRSEARLQSATTHGAEACLNACEAWAVLLRETMLGAEPEDALSSVSHLNLSAPVGSIFAGSWIGKSRSEIASSGYVLHSLEAALWCNAQSTDFREIILLAANLGHDADTTAAIAGQLAGARLGLEAIPAAWRNKLVWYEQLVGIADRLLRMG
jgi:ADP-ribosyl-[dinitrogen reductase] hydrolase